MAAIVFLGICLICATFNWQISVTGAVASITNSAEKVADFFKSTVDFFDTGNNKVDDWQPQDQIDGTGGAVSGSYLKRLLQEVTYGSRKIHYMGRWSWFQPGINLYYIEDNGKQYYFRVVTDPPNIVDENGVPIINSDIGGILNPTEFYGFYYIGTIFVEDWNTAGTYIFYIAVDDNRPFPEDVVIDVSQNGY